jgi:hypothetical protein
MRLLRCDPMNVSCRVSTGRSRAAGRATHLPRIRGSVSRPHPANFPSTSIVNKDINAAKALQGLRDKTLNVRDYRDIGWLYQAATTVERSAHLG